MTWRETVFYKCVGCGDVHSLADRDRHPDRAITFCPECGDNEALDASRSEVQ